MFSPTSGTSVTLKNVTDAPSTNDYFLVNQGTAGSIEFTGTNASITIDGVPQGASPIAVPTNGTGIGSVGSHTIILSYGTTIPQSTFVVNYDVRTSTTATTTVVGNVAPVLTLTPSAGSATTVLTNSGFGAFRPNTSSANELYSGGLSLNIVSTADQAFLTAEDAGSPAGNAFRGFLKNSAATGPYKLNTPLAISSTSVDSTITGTVTNASMQSDPPVQIASINDPVTNKSVGVTFTQTIVPNEPIRTGQYAMPVLFTLSTSTP
ncbi:hypothetical protein [Paraconexibacter algicola]|uniref:Uncharacterized protein n=1 Tax=Paraconexibacter algicola TaxID=2133960 RepID=A0A2T4UD87_9ACTN|nr:hypothetical protein [Paraconexibacter algicola]PTL55461.1 hypothetical protein C7Y72_17555 [Paraconexibacter algicola]